MLVRTAWRGSWKAAQVPHPNVRNGWKADISGHPGAADALPRKAQPATNVTPSVSNCITSHLIVLWCWRDMARSPLKERRDARTHH